MNEERDTPLGLALFMALVAAAIAVAAAEYTGYALFGSADAYVIEQTECELAKERSRQYATALTALLNRKTVTIGETTEVSCRVRHLEQS